MGVVRERSDGFRSGTLDGVSLTGESRLALQVKVDTLLLSLLLLLGVLLDTLDEILTGAGVLDVLDADVDALLEVAVADDLVEEDTDGGLGDVVDNTGLTVVDLVGHTVQTRKRISAKDAPHLSIPIENQPCWTCCSYMLSGGKGNSLTPSERHR